MVDDARDEAMPYGVDTIRLRISFPAAPVSRGYNGRMWRMRPYWAGLGSNAAATAARSQGGREVGQRAFRVPNSALPGGKPNFPIG